MVGLAEVQHKQGDHGETAMNRVPYWLIAAWLFFASALLAEEKHLDAQFFLQQGFDVAHTMPCNWDSQLTSVTLFGYYGTDAEAQGNLLFQDVITPLDMQVFGSNLLIKFDPSIMTHAGTNKPLHHVAIDYQTNNKRCDSGFSGFGGGGGLAK